MLGVDVGIGMKAEIKPALLAAQTQDGDHGDFLMVHAALQQQRCLTPRRPTAAHQRGHQKTAFIEKHQPGLQEAGFFLMALQVWRIQWRTAFSSRSMARAGVFGDSSQKFNFRISNLKSSILFPQPLVPSIAALSRARQCFFRACRLAGHAHWRKHQRARENTAISPDPLSERLGPIMSTLQTLPRHFQFPKRFLPDSVY